MQGEVMSGKRAAGWEGGEKVGEKEEKEEEEVVRWV